MAETKNTHLVRAKLVQHDEQMLEGLVVLPRAAHEAEVRSADLCGEEQVALDRYCILL